MALPGDPLAVSFSQATKCGGMRQVKATEERTFVAEAVITSKV